MAHDKLVSGFRLARIISGLSQAQVAKEAGLNQSSVSRIEVGLIIPAPKLRARLAAILDLSPDFLFPDRKDVDGR